MKTILFQGDSITDAQRNRQDDNYAGSGYATLVSAHLGLECPGKYKFYNRGISGVGVANLVSRTPQDFIGLSPDCISILIGVNDACHETNTRGYFDPEKFKALYTLLLEELTRELPCAKIILMSPFLLKGSIHGEKYPIYRKEVEKAAAVVKELAEKFGVEFIPLMEIFDKVEKSAPEGFWLYDGVHPTAAGHELIKKYWLEAFYKQEI